VEPPYSSVRVLEQREKNGETGSRWRKDLDPSKPAATALRAARWKSATMPAILPGSARGRDGRFQPLPENIRQFGLIAEGDRQLTAMKLWQGQPAAMHN